MDANTLLLLDPRQIQPDPANVRRADGDDLDGLVASIRAHGLLQPLGVARRNGGYRLVYGSRRRTAAIAAGLDRVPCLLLAVEGEEDGLVRQLAENLQRRDLNPIDQAEGLARVRRAVAGRRPGASEQQVVEATAAEVGLSAATVRRYLGLLELAPGVRELIAAGRLNVTQAQHLRAVGDPERQTAIAQAVAERELSAAQVARACRTAANRPNLPVEDVVGLAERGEPVPEPAAVAQRTPLHLPRPPRAEEPEDEPDEEPADEEALDERSPGREPTTRDGNRVFRIRSVGSFCDEVDRLARCLQDGDLIGALPNDPAAPLKLRLAARQLDFVRRALGEILVARGWTDQEEDGA